MNKNYSHKNSRLMKLAGLNCNCKKKTYIKSTQQMKDIGHIKRKILPNKYRNFKNLKTILMSIYFYNYERLQRNSLSPMEYRD